MSGQAPDQAGREALRQVRSALRWKRVEMGGSLVLTALAVGVGAAALVGAALGVIGSVIGAAIGLTLGGLGGLMLSAVADAAREARKLDRGNLPRARLARRRA